MYLCFQELYPLRKVKTTLGVTGKVSVSSFQRHLGYIAATFQGRGMFWKHKYIRPIAPPRKVTATKCTMYCLKGLGPCLDLSNESYLTSLSYRVPEILTFKCVPEVPVSRNQKFTAEQ